MYGTPHYLQSQWMYIFEYPAFLKSHIILHFWLDLKLGLWSSEAEGAGVVASPSVAVEAGELLQMGEPGRKACLPCFL